MESFFLLPILLAGNAFGAEIGSEVARSLMAHTHIPALHLDIFPDGCIESGHWQLLGLHVPPQEMRHSWSRSLSYAKRFQTCCAMLSNSRHASWMRLAATGRWLPLPLHSPRSYDLSGLTHAQQQQLLCNAGHACHFVRAMLPSDVRFNRDAREQLLLRLCSETVAERLLLMGTAAL